MLISCLVFVGCSSAPEQLDREYPIIRFLDSNKVMDLWTFKDNKIQQKGRVVQQTDQKTVGFNKNWQRALVVNAGTTKTLTQLIETDGVFEFSTMGAVFNSPDYRGNIDLQIRISDGRSTCEQTEMLPVATNPNTSWKLIRIPLNGFRGEVEFRFTAMGDQSQSGINNINAFVATPMFLPVSQPSKRNAIIWAFDSLRADDLGCYGSPDGNSPTLDQLSRKGTLFSQSLSTSSWTVPGVRNMLAGMVSQKYLKEDARSNSLKKFELPQVQSVFARAGYMTICISSNHLICPDMGFEKGFDILDTAASNDWMKGSAVPLYQRINKLMREYSDRPLFLYIHAMDPHDPYLPIEPYSTLCDAPDETHVRAELHSRVTGKLNRSPLTETFCPLTPIEKKYLRNYYRGEIRMMDSCFFAVLSLFERMGMFPDTDLIVTADHGEEFGEHGFYQHGYSLYESVLQVPMMAFSPEKVAENRLIPGWVSTHDIPQTLIAMADLLPDPLFEGMDLLRPGLSYPLDRTVASVSRTLSRPEQSIRKHRAIRGSKYKLLWDEDGTVRLLDLERYPDEKQSRAFPDWDSFYSSIEDKSAQQLGLALQELVDQTTHENSKGKMDPQWEAKLRELGYIE